MSSSIDTTSRLGGWATLKRAAALSPRLRDGLAVTIALALVATLGRLAIPWVVQQALDNGLAGAVVHTDIVWRLTVFAAIAVVVTTALSYVVNIRLVTNSEAGLAQLRVAAFRHVHDLSMLTQSTERRGSMVSRVTSDVDTVSQFVQFGGIQLIVSLAQILVSSVLMIVYNPLLAAVVWVCFVPVFFIIRRIQRILAIAYTAVRARVGDLLSAVSESVLGAATIRAHAAQNRTLRRVDAAIDGHRRASIGAQIRSVLAFSTGQLAAGLTLAVVLTVGTWLAVHDRLSLGELLAFVFLVNLFTQPVQSAAEILNELQNAIAGWRRVIGVMDTPTDIPDPGPSGARLPRGPIDAAFEAVTFGYPGKPPLIRDLSFHIPAGRRIAIVGETGSGKSTIGKLLTRLVDPDRGRVLLGGVDARTIGFASLRASVVLVPQEGFLFEGSIADNIRFAEPSLTSAQLLAAAEDLGLGSWLAGLPNGLDTAVGPRGEQLSAGERQLVALIRASVVDADLFLLDEATSSVDPGTEVRIQRALERLTAGRTSIAIAHRLSTAQAADEVLVVDGGAVVERGHHTELAGADGVYTRLHQAWMASQR